MDLNTILSALSGKRVSAKTIPGNTVEVWLDVPPRSDDALVIAVDAPWRLVQAGSVITTSAEIPWDKEEGESQADYHARNDAARRTSDILTGRVLEDASCDGSTGDLTITFDGDLTLQSFTVWRDEPQWTLRLYAEGRRVGPGLDEPL